MLRDEQSKYVADLQSEVAGLVEALEEMETEKNHSLQVCFNSPRSLQNGFVISLDDDK